MLYPWLCCRCVAIQKREHVEAVSMLKHNINELHAELHARGLYSSELEAEMELMDRYAALVVVLSHI